MYCCYGKVNKLKLLFLVFYIDFLSWKEEVKTIIYTMIYSSSKYIQIQYLTFFNHCYPTRMHVSDSIALIVQFYTGKFYPCILFGIKVKDLL